MASRRHIPRGCRTEFIPGLTEESKSLYEAYKTQYSNSPFGDETMESGNALLDSMIEEKKRRWEEVIRLIKSLYISHIFCFFCNV